MQHTLRLGLIGYGQRGPHLLKMAAAHFPGVAATAVCDADEKRLAAARDAYPDAALFTSVDQMLDEVKLEAVLVITPATLHTEFCAKALAKNVHVMSDVPAVASMDEARTLWEAEQESEALYMMGANPNTWGFVDSAVELVEQDRIGHPYYMEAEYIHDLRSLWGDTPWRKTYESIRYCTHSLGPLLRLIDEDLDSVSCFDTGSHVNNEEGQHDAMAALFRTRSNITIRFLSTFINNYPGEGHGYRIYGTKGYFERRMKCTGAEAGRTMYYVPAEHDQKALHEIPAGEQPADVPEGMQDGHGGADYALLNRFFRAVREGQPAPVPLREALRMTLPGIAAVESARNGGVLTRIRYPWA